VLPVTSLEHPHPSSTIVVIPARYESTRFPGKPLALIAGRPMIEHVYRRAMEARDVSRVLVATDDDRIARAVMDFGGEAVMTRRSHASGTDRLAEVAPGLDCDVIVNLQGDEPLVSAAMIDQVVAPFRRDATLLMTSLRSPIATRAELDDPNVVKVVVDLDDFAMYFSRAPIPFERDGAVGIGEPVQAWRHIGLYAYRRDFLPRFAALPPTRLEKLERLEQLRALEHGIRIKVPVTIYDAIGVDTPADLARVEAMVVSGGKTGQPSSTG
jgi:3-deoxy-manno-octulosonate cytidylyltransferase (CMP-KDO synthetase)